MLLNCFPQSHSTILTSRLAVQLRPLASVKKTLSVLPHAFFLAQLPIVK